ncbi:formate dehydrogenase accessory sulfurtransferase FdhD [Persicimonas caeni]|uniref:Sulfur carrier protein FdhD n=1 Tax=Persicimonas caeni TaxID=2292766 RepID=A0A4Y6PZR9_PERCE|nr:formate dehydrogenase accessory sulfurtransferase FdhD [Persicimonas caeni]QDG53507.1 formate dehydrogenase accessory sulfurtransferase FdhD [Persicimonas caeni]QED34728.1 formate dehydrogenase accessory sulfurtransferase FdhD [Persicimonas caeni]
MTSELFHNSASATSLEARRVGVVRYGDDAPASAEDVVATEEPLEIRLGFLLRGKPAQKSVSVTMRTPGHDRELAAGFLYGEGMLYSAEDIEGFELCAGPEDDAPNENILRVHLADHVEVDTAALTRHFYTTSSCGVCGKASIEALEVKASPLDAGDDFRVSARLLGELPGRLREAQDVFEETGGLHAAGLFDAAGHLLSVHEDVGRHNAMDKLVGSQFLAGKLPLARTVAVWSGRASFELVQKAVMAQIPVVVAVGAPSTLAVDLAEQFGVTLVGFARAGRFNIYTHSRRISFTDDDS